MPTLSVILLLCLWGNILHGEEFVVRPLHPPSDLLEANLEEDEEVLHLSASVLSESGLVAGTLTTDRNHYIWTASEEFWTLRPGDLGTLGPCECLEVLDVTSDASLLLTRCFYGEGDEIFCLYRPETELMLILDPLRDGREYHPSCLRDDGKVLGTYYDPKQSSRGIFLLEPEAGLIRLPLKIQKWPLIGTKWHPYNLISPDGESFLVQWKKSHDPEGIHYRWALNIDELLGKDPEHWEKIGYLLPGPLHLCAIAGDMAVGHWNNDFEDDWEDQGIALRLDGKVFVEARYPVSYALDCNTHGEVVGWFRNKQTTGAFLWRPLGEFSTLAEVAVDPSGEAPILLKALKINDRGQILVEVLEDLDQVVFALVQPKEDH